MPASASAALSARKMRWLAFITLASSSLFATTLVDETFTDGSLIAGGDALDMDWFAASAATAAIVSDDAGLGNGNALQHQATGSFSRTTAAFPSPTTLTATGDRLTVSLRLRTTRFSAANEGGLRFGLHHNHGSVINASTAALGWTTNTESWEGYYFRGGVGTETGMRIYRDLNDPGNSAMGGSGDVTIGNGTAFALADTAPHTARLEIERQNNSQNTLRFYWDGTLLQETSTATIGGALSTFTNFTIGAGATELDLLLDDVSVTLTNVDGGSDTPIDLDARLVDWTRAGVQGGIPSTYANSIGFVSRGGDATGLIDNSSLLQEIIDEATTDTVITFPAGTYRFENRINFRSTSARDLPGIIIRGAGTDLTKFHFVDPAAEDTGLFHITGFESGSAKSITGGLTQGSTSLTLDTTTDLAVGDWLWIRQDNDPDAMATNRDIPDYDSTIAASGWAARVVGQVVQIAAVTGSGVELVQPLHLDFTWPNPTAQRLGTVSGLGFENFTLENGIEAAGRFNFDFTHAVNCWIKNVHSLMAKRAHVAVTGSANLEIRDAYFNDAYDHGGGGHGYGVLLQDTTTHTLVENNVFRRLRHAMIWKEGANGNVFAYNYSTDGIQDGSPVAKDISGHGHYAFANLIEGNIAQFIHASDYWGPVGPHNTFLRNRTTAERILIEDNSQDQNILGNELVSSSSPFVVIDGTSTGAYVHGNNEGGSLQWRSDDPQTIVTSYRYANPPAFWDITDPWPSIGPERTPGTYTIPAKHRWDSGQMRLFATTAANGRLSNLSTRGQILSGDDILIAGFVIAGTADQTVLLRGLGPALDAFLTPATTIDDPTLTVYRDGEAILSNDNWSDQADPSTVASTAATVGALALTPDSRDAALVATLSPGAYSMHLSGNNATGIALAEIYDANGGADAQLLNISTRGRVGTGDTVMVPGIVVTEANRRLLIRGVGPELAASFGFATDSILTDPVLTLTNSSGEVITSNDDWESVSAATTAEITAVASQVGAFPLTSGGADAVLLLTLPPGIYTAQVTDADGGEGIAIVEVYAVPE